MRTSRARAVLAAALIASVAVTVVARQRHARAVSIEDAPAAAASRSNPFAGREDAVAAGRKLYVQHCGSCHGREARGGGRAPDLHDAGIREAPDGSLEWFLRNGSLASGMPSWSGLPEQRRWQMVAYLESLRDEPVSR